MQPRSGESDGGARPAVPLAEIWRGGLLESVHFGHAVICNESGEVVEAWGDPAARILPRSACKMVQALPLVESGAADAFGLTPRRLALACASHSAAAIQTREVESWLGDLGLTDGDLRCGAHEPFDREARDSLIRAGEAPRQAHNNCSGKHTGFLTLAKRLGAGAEYVAPDHAVQRACLEAFESVTAEPSPGHAIDGCSAPNFMTSLHGLARAMAFFAAAQDGADTRQSAAARLREAMIAHPEMIAGEGRACTMLMRACTEPVALKTGAEGVYAAILPQRRLGVALKAADGASRAAECAAAAILARLGALDAAHESARAFADAPLRNWRGIEVGAIRPAEALR